MSYLDPVNKALTKNAQHVDVTAFANGISQILLTAYENFYKINFPLLKR